MDLSKLKEPLDHKTRPGPGNTTLSYITARQLQDRLDDVCGPENWTVEFKEMGEHLVGRIGIRVGDEWVWKEDVGTESNIEGEKGAFSDAFKRAGVMWGCARYLYGEGTAAPSEPPSDEPSDKQLNYLDSLLKKEEVITPGEGDRCWKKLGATPTKAQVTRAIEYYKGKQEARDAQV